MTVALKPRQDIAQEIKMWRAIKDGSFVEKYTDELKEYRSALQQAIDENAQTVRIMPKTEIEDGDLQMFDGKGWQPFNIFIARDLIVNHDKMIAIRQFLNGQWVDQNELTASFNKSFRNQYSNDINPIYESLSEEEQDKMYFIESHRRFARN